MATAHDGIPLLVRSGRNPFEVLMLVACVATGVVGLFQPASASNVVTSLLPSWEVATWYSGLTLGGVVGLFGVSRKGVMSLMWERVGLIMLTFLMLAYSTAVITQVGVRGSLPAFFTGLFAIACAIRFVYITTDLKRMEDITATRLDGE
jgi:hypothetical protein